MRWTPVTAALMVMSLACGSSKPAPKSNLTADDFLVWQWGNRDGGGSLSVSRAGAVRYERGFRGGPAMIDEATISSEQVAEIGERLTRAKVCQLSSERDGVPDEARPSLSVRFSTLDCAITLWDGEWDKLGDIQSVLRDLRTIVTSKAATNAGSNRDAGSPKARDAGSPKPPDVPAAQPKPGFAIRPLGRTISHSHGGKPALIGSVEFTLTNPTSTPVNVQVKELRWLTGVGRAKARRIDDVTLDGQAASATMAILPGTAVKLSVRFEPVKAYFVAHERFAIEVDFLVDNKAMTLEAPINVIRRTPFRR